MADRFVSAGNAEEPEHRDDEWLAAQQELDKKALQRKQAEAKGSGLQEGGKTLYETLQANKAAKQDAFEESIKLKNQFRALDDDEIDFLDQVMDSTRQKEQEVKKQTAEQLEAFRRQREEAEKVANAAGDGENNTEDVLTWRAAPKKRKKSKPPDKESLKAAKLRKMSSNAQDEEVVSKDQTPKLERTFASEGASETLASSTKDLQPKAPIPAPGINTGSGLGLDAYSSDED